MHVGLVLEFSDLMWFSFFLSLNRKFSTIGMILWVGDTGVEVAWWLSLFPLSVFPVGDKSATEREDRLNGLVGEWWKGECIGKTSGHTLTDNWSQNKERGKKEHIGRGDAMCRVKKMKFSTRKMKKLNTWDL